MLTNAEIRLIPTPQVTDAVREIVLREPVIPRTSYYYNSPECYKNLCITMNENSEMVILNVFGLVESEVRIIYRFFMGKDECKIQSFNDSKSSIREATPYNALERNFYPYSINGLSLTEHEKIKRAICILMEIEYEPKIELYTLLSWYTDSIINKRTQKRENIKQEKLELIMKKVKELPKDFPKTLDKALSDAHYGFYNRKSKTCTCSACGKTFSLTDLEKVSENSLGKCPECDSHFLFSPDGFRKRKKEYRTAIWVQAAGEKQLLIRYFEVRVTYANRKESVSTEECLRSFVDFTQKKVTDFEYWFSYSWSQRVYENSELADEMCWKYPKKSMYYPDGIHRKLYKGTVHQNGLMKEFKKAGLEKILSNYRECTKEIIRRKPKGNIYRDVRYIEAVAQYPFLERLTKVKLYNLAMHYIFEEYGQNKFNLSATNLTDMFSVSKGMLKQMIEADPTYEEMSYVEMAKQGNCYNRSLKEIIETARYFKFNEREALKLSKADERKLKVYLEKGKINKRDYFDYLGNAEKNGHNINAEIVKYPKDFKKAHDDAATEAKAKKNEKALSIIATMVDDMKKTYNFSDEELGLCIMAPDSGKDIINEGEALHHCVGTYLDRVCTGKSIILFVRKLSEIAKPFVTVEINPSTKSIVQARAFSNAQPEDKVWKFLEKFKEKLCIA